MQQRGTLGGLAVARITGTLQSMRFAMPPVGLFTRALYRWQATLPRDFRGHIQYRTAQPLPPAAILELKFWRQQLSAWNGAALRPSTFSRVLYTDASGQGWGAQMDHGSCYSWL